MCIRDRGWAAGFAGIASRVFNATSDSRLKSKVACNEVADDTATIQSAIDLIAATGGGVMQFPPGTCRLAGSLILKSGVVLQGAGKDRTVIKYEGNYPLWGREVDLSGVRELTLMNKRGRIESPLLQNSTRVFFQNVKFALNGGIQMFLTDNRNFIVSGSDFIQPKNPEDSGPYTMGGCSGLTFKGNTTTFANGAPTFTRVHDAYFANNRFTRDARDNQNSKGVIHSFTMDFAHRIAIVNNTFDVFGGPISNKDRNDGETMLTEGGGGQRTENLGVAANATATTLSDPGNNINVMPFSAGNIPENYGVAIVGGKGAGQSRRVTAYSAGTLSVDKAWVVVPDSTSHYATFVWGLEKSLIKGNTLSQNPRGIWLYQTAVREVDIIGNKISEGGGIYLRSAQKLSLIHIYNYALVRINDMTVISQRCYLCTGSHDYTHPHMPLIWKPIVIGSECWVAAEAFIAPGVKIGNGVVIGARSVVTRNMPDWMVCAGNPCLPIKPRVIKTI